MDRIWLDAPTPAWRVLVTGGAATVQANAAAVQWAQHAGVSQQDLQALAQAPTEGDVQLLLGPCERPCSAVPLPGGALFWLQVQPSADGDAAAQGAAVQGGREPVGHAQLAGSALGVGFWTLDHDNPSDPGTWDAQMYRLYGRAPDSPPPTMPQWLAECVDPQDHAVVLARVEQARAQNAPTTELLVRLVRPDADGRQRWVQSWSRRGSGRRSRTSYGMHMDVSEQQRALAVQQEQQRLELARHEQSTFMARMSHELRTPMNAVIGFTRLLQTDREPLSDRQRERLGYIATASGQLMALIDDLLAIASADARPAPAPFTAGMHVLCVEDNPVNLQLVRELIALRPAIRLSTAVDGLSGVATALAEPPDLVLLDLQLPDIDGLEVLRRLRAAPTTARCRIVALSADAMPEHIKTAMAAGFDDYWTKPIQFDGFLAGLDRLVVAARPGA